MIPFVSDFIAHFKNARSCIKQIRDGEWIPRFNNIDKQHYTAHRGEYRLWLANGSFFCEIDEFKGERCLPAFGLFFRHYVWFAAARRLKIEADSGHPGKRHHPIL